MKKTCILRLRQQTFILVICLLFNNITVKAQWTFLNTGVKETFYSVNCINKDTVLVCGTNGIILKTQDGGTSWQQKRLVDNEELRVIKFANDSVGYAAGIWDLSFYYDVETMEIKSYCLLLKTTDGGETWQQLIKDSSAGFI